MDDSIALDFLKSKSVESPERFLKGLDTAARNKLDVIIHGDLTRDDITFQSEFDKFTILAPQWKINTVVAQHTPTKRKSNEMGHSSELDFSAVISEVDTSPKLFWTQFSEDAGFDGEGIKKVMIIRQQNSGLCYLHAPVVIEHYMISIVTKCENVSMINIGLMEKDLLSGHDIEKFILEDRGGSSQAVLSQLCDLGAADTTTFAIPRFGTQLYQPTCLEILGNLLNRPALVSNFHVTDAFLSTGTALTGVPVFHADDQDNRHSMVLIGGRQSVDGEIYFLLQNWWHDRFFVEVSGEYFSYCTASITFVDKAITKTKILQRVVSSYAETSIDKGERVFER